MTLVKSIHHHNKENHNMMGVYGYPKKKDLKAAVGKRLQYVETSFFGPEFKPTGRNIVVGPDAYSKRDWFATVTTVDGIITKVE